MHIQMSCATEQTVLLVWPFSAHPIGFMTVSEGATCWFTSFRLVLPLQVLMIIIIRNI